MLTAVAALISLLSTQVPSISASTTAYELGTRIQACSAGQVTALRYDRLAGDTGPHTGHLWDATGHALATVVFANETASGWQQQALVTPVRLTAAQTVTVSVNVSAGGHFAIGSSAFAAGFTNGCLSTPTGGGMSSTVVGAYPSSPSPHNYFRDLVFQPDPVPVLTVAPLASPAGVVQLQATLTGGAAVQFLVDGKPAVAAPVASFSVPFDLSGLASGAHTLTATSGASSAAAVTFTIAPTVSGVPIVPGQDIQSIVNANPAGTAFVLRSGTHRMQTITPKAGDTFTGEAGTILSGAKVLAGATGTGPWVYTGQTQEGTFNDAGGAAYQAGHDASGHPEDLFFDNVLKQHVGTLAEGVPGTWFFDYPNDTIYVFDNPSGHVVETSVTPTAISAASIASTFTALTIEKYASLTQTAAIVLGGGATMLNCEVRWNHYAGIETGTDAVARGNNVHHNGVFGFIGSGNALVENNEIAYNNTVFGDSFWGAGGSKWVYGNGLIVRGNFSHHNLGPGLWTDINNINVLYENNRIEDNLRAGIVHEISYDAVIRNNQIARNGNGHFYPGWPTEGGIAVIDSRNVEVYGNTLTDNWGGIGALQDNRAVVSADQNNGIWEMRNFHVHDNTTNQQGTIQAGAGMTGIIGPDGQPAVFTSMGNNFTTNHYALGANTNYFLWSAGATNETAWKAAGQDTGGTFTR